MIPKELLNLTTDSLHDHIHRRTNIIYVIVLSLVVAIVVSLPFIKVNVSIHAPALIRPSADITIIRSLVSGQVKGAYAIENRPVNKGDLLFLLENPVIEERDSFLRKRIAEISQFLTDIESAMKHVTDESNGQEATISSPVYQQSLIIFKQTRREYEVRLEKVKRDYDRNDKLHKEKVISDSDFENFSFELDKAKQELASQKESQLNTWQREYSELEIQLHELKSQLTQLEKEKQNLFIRSPIKGTLQKNLSIYSGSIVAPNQELVQISPDTSLIVEAFVSPNDIGLLKKSMLVRVQVDAFNYNQWGMASGRITDISNDIYFNNDKPVFKIRCSLNEAYLTLKNGYRGYLRKGMTVQTRFMVTERSLWNLLYDKIDDWVNPQANHAD